MSAFRIAELAWANICCDEAVLARNACCAASIARSNSTFGTIPSTTCTSMLNSFAGAFAVSVAMITHDLPASSFPYRLSSIVVDKNRGCFDSPIHNPND